MMKKINLLLLLMSVLVCSVGADSARALTVTLTYDDPCSVMGTLNNDDGDLYSLVATGHGGTPSKPYISTAFATESHSGVRRAIAEFAMEPMRNVSLDPGAITSATLRFYFDDVIFPGNSPEPYTAQDFTLELYTETANGALDGVDANDADVNIGGEGLDDWGGAVVQSWHFLAGEVGGLTAGNEIVGMFGPDEPFPANFGDDELAIYGMIGFEVDVAEALRVVLNDPNISYVGFRWICNSEGGYWTSMDPAGYLPSLSVDIEPPLIVTLTYDDPCSVMGTLNNDDGDLYSQVATGHGGTLSKPYISTAFATESHSGVRCAIAEFAMEPMRDVSLDPNAVLEATLRFYFDDVIFPGNSPEPYTAQDFTLELYTETANGMLDGADADDSDSAIGGDGLDDWSSTVVQSWHFLAGEVGELTAGNEIVGMFGPDEPFPANFGDDELAIYGMIGFEVDVVEALRVVLNDPNISYVGFRWICNSEGGYWTSMDPAGYLPSLSVGMSAPEPLVFRLQSTDTGEITGSHAGRMYPVADGPDDEALYITVGEWSGGHNPDAIWTWPIEDGIIDWDTFSDPNQNLDEPEAVTYDNAGNMLYVYWDIAAEDYVLVADQNTVAEGLEKVYYEPEVDSCTLNIGNNGTRTGALADRQHVLLSEFNLMRPGRYGLDPDNLASAYIELTIDRIIDMSLNGNNMALLPTALYVNAYAGDGILNEFENVQADFERIDHDSADVSIWLTVDGTVDGVPITDYSLSWYKLVDPGLGEEFTINIDVTDAVRQMLQDGVAFAGFVFSCSDDGEFCLASVDLVDMVNDATYLPTLVIETDLQ